MVRPEETFVVLMLEGCAGEAAELLSARGWVTVGWAVSAGEVPSAAVAPGTPVIRKVTNTVTLSRNILT